MIAQLIRRGRYLVLVAITAGVFGATSGYRETWADLPGGGRPDPTEVNRVAAAVPDAVRADGAGARTDGTDGQAAVERQTGACCAPSGDCTVEEQSTCEGGGGTYLGDGTTCDPNCCPQDPTGADCACNYDYKECYDVGVPTGMPCETAGDCVPGETCEDRSCTGPTLFPFDTMEILVDPAEYVTFQGDSSGAEFTPELGDDCSLDFRDKGWYEGFALNDDTPGDEYDDCWVVTADMCCNDPARRPNWILLRECCPCPEADLCLVGPDIDAFGNPRHGYGPECNAEHCCPGENFSLTYTLGPGDYRWQIYGMGSCELSFDYCEINEDCPPEELCIAQLAPYIGHFTVEACAPAACCLNRCVGGANDGNLCDEEAYCAPGGGECRTTCEDRNRLWCEGAGGQWLGALEFPVADCSFDPCDFGACCIGPGACDDVDPCDTEDGCEDVCFGIYHGGMPCTDWLCPVCLFEEPENCHFDDPDGFMIPVDRLRTERGADDFKPTGDQVSHICWTPGFYAPGIAECAEHPPADDWDIAFYADDGAGMIVEPAIAGPMDVTVQAKVWRGSRVWDYQGTFTPVDVTPGECYWVELSGSGNGTCITYWNNGLGNGHALRDLNDEWGVEDAQNYDFRFCLDCGMADNDCGDILGACCTCPPGPGVPGICEEGLTHDACLDQDGTWTLAGTCIPNPCPGQPENNDCADAEEVNAADFTAICNISGDPCPGGDPDCPEGETCVVGQMVYYNNKCATDDGELGTACAGSGDLYLEVWFEFVNGTAGLYDLAVSSCDLVSHDQMMAVYDGGAELCDPLPEGLEELACSDDDCGQGAGPSEIPNGYYPDALTTMPGGKLLLRVGGWDNPPENTGDTRGEGYVLFSISNYVPYSDCNNNGVYDGDDITGGTSNDCNGNEIPDECDIANVGSVFDDPSSWATYDYGEDPSGCASDPNCTDPDGYSLGCFDGQFAYFVPSHNGTVHNGEVLRYDPSSAFDSPSSWAAYDPGENGVGSDADGYFGCVSDGQYVYFAPNYNGSEHHGEVLRFDTGAPFDNASSWATYDPGANGVGTDPDGYEGLVFDGRYVYFSPYDNGTGMHGEVLRYDTQGTFASPSSWATYDYGADPSGCASDPNCTDPDGYPGAVFDGRYVYFVPFHNGSAHHGEVLRHDTQGTFDNASSWAAFDPGENGVGDDPDGYITAVFDGQYVYFVPGHNGSEWHGEVLRYDTSLPFASAPSWNTFDAKATDPPGGRGGYGSAAFDGQYVYFAPYLDGGGYHGEVLRYDTSYEFDSASSWATYDPGDNGVGIEPDGYSGAVFDGRFIYFAPLRNESEYHGEVLRYDAGHILDCNENGILDECDIAGVTSEDCAGNGIPDECEPDCNENGVADSCDIDGVTSEDCNDNDLPDECEIDENSDPAEFFCDPASPPPGLDACDPDCDTNGIPDECDIAACDPQADSGCDDCNLNGVPDECDIALGTSTDDYEPFGVPDECHEWDDESGDDQWSTDENWDGDTTPDNDGGETFSVTIRGSAGRGGTVYLDMPATIDALRLLDAATLYVDGADDESPAWDLTIVTQAGLLVQGYLDTDEPDICPSSNLYVANSREIDVSVGQVTIAAAGRYQATGSPVSAALSAQNLSILKGRCECPQALGGFMQLIDSMSVTVGGDFILDGSDVAVCPNCCDGSKRGGVAPPPKAASYNDSVIDVSGDLIINGVADVFFGLATVRGRGPTAGMLLGGDFVNHSVYPTGFNWLNGFLMMNGSVPQTFEVAGTDRDAEGAGFDHNFAMGTLEVAAGRNVKFIDLFDNDGQGLADPEALYVDELILRVESKSTTSITLDKCTIYYHTLINEGAEINRVRGGELVAVGSVVPLGATGEHAVPKNRYISFIPNNGDITAAFRVEMTGSAYFPGSVPMLGWVGEPFEAPEDPGVWIARVADTAFYTGDWPSIVDVGDCEIVPAATYEIRATVDGTVFSTPLEVSTIAQLAPKYWADCVGWFGGSGWSPPNGAVNMDDVMAGVQKFKRADTAPHITWMDIDGEIPNQVLNMTDIMMIVQGFKSEPYPFSDPGACP